MDIEATLRQEIEAHMALGRPALAQRFILRNGKAWTSAPKPRDIPKGKPGRCYMNASHLALDDCLYFGLTYVEGYATSKDLGGILISHAWCVDEDDKVIDNTWRNPKECIYFGVPFKMPQLHEELKRNGVYGLLGTGSGINADLIFHLDPELEREILKLRKAIPRTRAPGVTP